MCNARSDAEETRACGAIAAALIVAKGDTMVASSMARHGPLADALVGRDVEQTFDETCDMKIFTRANVGATVRPDSTAPTAVLMTRALSQSVLGDLPRARRVPFRSSGRALMLGSAAAWVQAGEAIPLVRAEFASLAHSPRFVAAMAVYTKEAADAITNDSEAFAAELTAMLAEQINAKLSSDDAPTAAAPAGLAYGATAISSTGTTIAQITADCANAIDVIADAGYMPDAWLLSPKAAATVRLLKVADAGGDTLAGLPILSGVGVKGVTLLDSSRIALSLGDRVVLGVSAEGDVEMVDNPGADSTVPTPATTNMVVVRDEFRCLARRCCAQRDRCRRQATRAAARPQFRFAGATWA